MRGLCCGAECAVGPKNTGYCHRWDFTSEAARIRALLDRHGEMPTRMDRSSDRKKRSKKPDREGDVRYDAPDLLI
jgi:hypothetical protein